MAKITVNSNSASDKHLLYLGKDIPWLLQYQADTRSDHVFLHWVPADESLSKSWTYSQFLTDVKKVALGLQNKGVNQGDRVLIHLDNCPEILLSWYACAWLGAVAVTTNTRSAGPEVAYFAEHSEAVAAITQPNLAEQIKEYAQNLKWIAVTGNNAGEPDSAPEYEKFSTLLDNDGDIKIRQAQHMLDVGIQYTSGTTSRPKGVVWTHANALWGGEMCARNEDLKADDVHLTFLPMFHTNAQSYSVLASLWSGATVVLLPRFSASRFWAISMQYKCTWCSLIPFCFKALIKQPVPDHHYRYWGTGAAIPLIEQHFKIKMVGWWGMTETITHGICTNHHHEATPLGIGRPAPEYEVAVVDDEGNMVTPGETGHLLIKGVRGVTLFKEYLKNKKATQESFDKNGWFRTGDRIRIGECGDLFFSDRDKDMLKVGAENVAASEIERVIASVPGVSESAVVAKPHKMLDEVPVAFVIAQADHKKNLEELIIKACEENLADFKVPDEIILVEELPRSLLEKINKSELRKRFEK